MKGCAIFVLTNTHLSYENQVIDKTSFHNRQGDIFYYSKKNTDFIKVNLFVVCTVKNIFNSCPNHRNIFTVNKKMFYEVNFIPAEFTFIIICNTSFM